MRLFQRSRSKYWLLGAAGFIMLLLGIIPLRLCLVEYFAPQPQAILTLGGGPEREEFTAQFAQRHPDLEIWVSTGIEAPAARNIFRAKGIPVDRLHLDYRAVDTVTNFTTMVNTLQQRDIHHVYLITSDFHMNRSMAIATLVFGSQGIAVTPISIPLQDDQHESVMRTFRDSGRSLLWIATGRTGASLGTNDTLSKYVPWRLLDRSKG
jgi:uncharacterized SAM-binding protein YcdF (DUF218 family)